MNKKKEVNHQPITGDRKALQTLRQRAQSWRRDRLIEERRTRVAAAHRLIHHAAFQMTRWHTLGVRPGRRSFTGLKPWKGSSFQTLKCINTNENITAMSGLDKCHKYKEIASDVCVFTRKPGAICSRFVACLLLVSNLHVAR